MRSSTHACRQVRPLVALLLAVASIMLLRSVPAEAQTYASCSGSDVCAGQSSTASGSDGVVHCCPTGGYITSQVNNNVYCSQEQDCTPPPPPPSAPPASTCPSGQTCTSGTCWTAATSTPGTVNCICSGGVQMGAQRCSDCEDRCYSYGRRTVTSCHQYSPTITPASDTNVACNLTVDGVWTSWGACSVLCGGGTQTRSCSNPAPSGNGAACVGESEQTCNTSACDDPSAVSSTGTDSSPPADETTNAATSILSHPRSIILLAGAAAVANGMRAVL